MSKHKGDESACRRQQNDKQKGHYGVRKWPNGRKLTRIDVYWVIYTMQLIC